MMELNFDETLKHVEKVWNYVQVETVDGKTREGWLSTIDPCSGNLLLVSFRENKKIDTVHLIVADAVAKLSVIRKPDDEMKTYLQEMFSTPKSPISSEATEDMQKKKALVLAWLQKNLLPVKEQGAESATIDVMDSLTIYPPYGPENCISNNDMLLERIQQLLNNVPEAEN